MQIMNVNSTPRKRGSRSLEGALIEVGLSNADLEKKPVKRAISIAENAFRGLLRDAPPAVRVKFAVQTILCGGNALGLPEGSPVRQWELKEDLSSAGVPRGDVMTVENNIKKALDSYR